jgi:integrase
VFKGARRNEILTLRWDHVDLERGWLNLADSKTGAKTIYLNAPSRQLGTSKNPVVRAAGAFERVRRGPEG